jgi:hypothetical protein
MSDIADKIYAATGLTLGAEAAAKIGHMIRLARQEAADEIEKLRRENEIMVGMINDMGTIVIKARAALGEKE